MAWYQCSGGFLKEVTPQIGDAVASVNHLHRSARVDGTAAIVRMEEIPCPQSRGVEANIRVSARP
jgi:hypothetical protein